MKKILAIVGAGHLGQQIAHFAITDKHYEHVVFFDDFVVEKHVLGYDILGGVNSIESSFNKGFFDEILIGIGYKHLYKREELYNLLHNKIPFGTIIHSSCWVDATARIASGVIIYPNSCIDANTVVDANTVINVSCSIAHDTYIGKHCFLSPNVAIAGFVEVGIKSIIGINSTIIDNIKLVSETQLGGGTVVIKNLTRKGLYVGNPARFIK
ncbi:acetyltransferase [uncultured Zobellia sp.]|uniref:acetyltransferase n=1 Tax=uncultured Zobellia sp. TaxID=255433 RepID=UPI002593CC37|nr:acetyltransferase [uncultured Zobellia sp.]